MILIVPHEKTQCNCSSFKNSMLSCPAYAYSAPCTLDYIILITVSYTCTTLLHCSGIFISIFNFNSGSSIICLLNFSAFFSFRCFLDSSLSFHQFLKCIIALRSRPIPVQASTTITSPSRIEIGRLVSHVHCSLSKDWFIKPISVLCATFP